MRQHGGDCPARNEFLEMAVISMALHGRTGLGIRVCRLSSGTSAGKGISKKFVQISLCLSINVIANGEVDCNWCRRLRPDTLQTQPRIGQEPEGLNFE